jgi:hypothetical protein
VSALNLRALLETLTRYDVRFVIVGAVAVAAHGYVRGTADLDIVPDDDRANLKRLPAALVELGSTLPLAENRPFDPARDPAALESHKNVTLDTRLGGLDVMQRIPGIPTYDELDREAIQSDLLGVPVRVCSLRHLRAMKDAAGRPQDLLDLSNLPEV